MSFGGNREGGFGGGGREGGRGGDREGGRGGDRGGDGARRPFFRRKKTCPFSGANAPKIDYKDVKLLQRFISERGKIVPARMPASFHQSMTPLPVFVIRRPIGFSFAESQSSPSRGSFP
jgi:small subunit ribosomal protein S18